MVPSIKIPILVLFLLSVSLSRVYPQPSENDENTLRVKVLQTQRPFTVDFTGSCRITDLSTGRLLKQANGYSTVFKATKDGMIHAAGIAPCRRILIDSLDDEGFRMNNRVYRGDLEVLKKDNTLIFINRINIEDYVKGVSVREISQYWPYESLKAHAVVFRTYAMYQKSQNKGRDFDLTDDAYSQGYSGKSGERYRITEAAEETKGEVLFFEKNILAAFFHSTCAGHTEDASNLWAIDMPPLKGVVCGFCKASPHFAWEVFLSRQRIKELIKKAGFDIGDIMEIRTQGKNNSRRVISLYISGKKDELVLSSKVFRDKIGVDTIRSTNFTVDKDGDGFRFKGLGWGHGVGLCQWGAYFMSKNGYSYERILKYYFPGAMILKTQQTDS